jgi:hypothetical protein
MLALEPIKMARRGLGVAVLLLAAQQGMAAAATPAAGTVQIDACSLLTEAQITQVIGMPVDKGQRRDEGPQTSGAYSSACFWVVRVPEGSPANPMAPMGGRSFVILNAMQWPSGSNLARTYLEAFYAAADSGEIPSQPVARKFGDDALWWGDGLAVRVRDVSFGVSVFLPTKSAKSTGFFEERLAPNVLQALAARERKLVP